MSDERDALDAAMKAIQAPQSLRVLHKTIIVDQDAATVGVKIPDDAAPSATAKPVPLWFGLPGFAAVFSVAATPESSIGFHGGKENGAFATLFPMYPQRQQSLLPTEEPLPVESLSFGAGTKPIARVDDTTKCGKIYLRQTPIGPMGVPSILAISYRAGGASSIEVPIATIPIPGPMIPLSPDPDNPDPTVACIVLNGIITSGRTEFLA